jgi:glyoxylase-like metal-dependent hydrolase (beta-lactamase superfamily II)
MQLTEYLHLVGSGIHGFSMSHASDSHVFLVDGGAEAALLEAGAGIELPPLLGYIERTGVRPDRIRKLFISHAHADHAGGSAKLRTALRLELVASPEVADIIRCGDEQRAGVDIGKEQGSYARDYRFEPTPVDGELRDGDRIRVGDLEVEVVATPGHSAGHLSFLVHAPNRSDLFSGDALLFGGEIILQNTWDCDLTAQIDSLRRLGDHRFEGFFPSHLAFSVTDGERHLRVALNALDRGAIPPIWR